MYTPQLDKEVKERLDTETAHWRTGETTRLVDWFEDFLATELEAQKQEMVEIIEGMRMKALNDLLKRIKGA